MSKVYEALQKAEREQGTRPAPSPEGASIQQEPRILPEAMEAYRRILGNIQFADPDQPPKVIVVASSVSGEGASTVATDLALCAAGGEGEEHTDVLLVDTNFRTTSLHEVFGTSGTEGLVDVIRDGGALEEFVRPTGHPHLYLLTCGGVAHDPARLLGSQKMQALLAQLRDRFDLVILDGAPVASYSDTAVLGRYVDGVVLVVRAGKTRYEVAQQSRIALEQAGVPLLGVVLNCRRYDIPGLLYRRL